VAAVLALLAMMSAASFAGFGGQQILRAQASYGRSEGVALSLLM
jgi:hypothetical protein